MNAIFETGPIRYLLLTAVFVAVSGRALPAGDFSLEWGSVNGGVTSSGGNFSVSGTTGPTNLGAMSGGLYALEEGGHMGMAALSGRLSMAWINGDLIVTWPLSDAGWELDRADDLSLAQPVWTLVSPALYQTNEAAIVHILVHPASFGIYRLRKP